MPNTGKITQIIGAVLDIKFTEGHLPSIYEAIHITRKNGELLVVEVAQHLGDETVRCIAMGPTDWYAAWRPWRPVRRSRFR